MAEGGGRLRHGPELGSAPIRVALQDEADTPRYIETVPRKGYRFIGTMDPLAGARAGRRGDRTDGIAGTGPDVPVGAGNVIP